MFLFTVLLLALAIIFVVFVIFAIFGGLAYILTYADVIVFVAILTAIVVKLVKRKRK